MSFAQYRVCARETRIYPAQYAVLYPALKLTGEAGELLQAIQQGYQRRDVLKEAGDVLWYVAACFDDLGIADNAYQFQDFPRLTTFRSRLHNVLTVAENLVIAATQHAEHAGKILRDKGGNFKAEAPRLEFHLLNVLDALALLAYCSTTTLADIATVNLEKLASRQKRGVLSGSGNDR